MSINHKHFAETMRSTPADRAPGAVSPDQSKAGPNRVPETGHRSNPVVNQPELTETRAGEPAEIIGRTGYPLYPNRATDR